MPKNKANDCYNFHTGSCIGLTGLIFNLLLLICTFVIAAGWYAPNIYSPNLMFYQFNAFAMMMGSYFLAGIYQTQGFLASQFCFALLTIITMCFYLTELCNNSNLLDKFDGTIEYPQIWSEENRLLTITAQNYTTGDANVGFLTANIVISSVIVMFALIHCLLAIIVLNYGFEGDLNPAYMPFSFKAKGCDRLRIHGSTMAIIFTLMGVVSAMLSFVLEGLSVLPITLFSGADLLLYFCFFVAVYPPVPLPPIAKKHRIHPDYYEDLERVMNEIWTVWFTDNEGHGNEYFARRCGRVSGVHIVYLLIFCVAVIFQWVEIGANAAFRSQNGLPWTCVDETPFVNLIVDETPIIFTNGQQNITYSQSTIATGTLKTYFFGVFTCYDDWIKLMNAFGGLILFLMQIFILNIGGSNNDYAEIGPAAATFRAIQKYTNNDLINIEGIKNSVLELHKRIETEKAEMRRTINKMHKDDIERDKELEVDRDGNAIIPISFNGRYND